MTNHRVFNLRDFLGCSQKVMRGLGGLLDCLDAQHYVVCPVCVPPGCGDCLYVFVLCFPPSM